jgi:hypothetical protein
VNTALVSSWLLFKVACSKPLVGCHQNSFDGLLTSVAQEDVHRRSLTKHGYFARERAFFQNSLISLNRDLWPEIYAAKSH